MKKIILAALLAASSSMVFAADACVSGTASPVPGASDGTKFVKSGFTPVCSTNTVVVYTDDASKVYGGSASTKGASYFGASTEGGAVKKIDDCTNKNCGGTEAATKAGAGMDAAASFGSSS